MVKPFRDYYFSLSSSSPWVFGKVSEWRKIGDEGKFGGL